ncbi:radical SAM protein [Nocardia sp. NPDC050412]|uniref:radical SAM protein n=1 Tax=Nocardia sp. NPDC050412 TaxID=3364320 RepID=UPI00379DFA51
MFGSDCGSQADGNAMPLPEPTTLSAVVKIAERCNINCSYCYVFNAGDETYRERPKIMGQDVIEATAQFLLDGCVSLGISNLLVILHGGEPLLMGKKEFDRMCTTFREVLTPDLNMYITMQTNATLIDQDWLEIFARHHVRIGVSIDGPKQYNDEFRVTFKGGGTYDAARRGIDLLLTAQERNLIPDISALCVINCQRSADVIYNHIVHDLGIRKLDFLLPDFTHDTIGAQDPRLYGKFLCNAFDAWIADKDPAIEVRILKSVLSTLLGGPRYVSVLGREAINVVTIQSDGTLAADDTLRACGFEVMSEGDTIFDTTLQQFFTNDLMKRLSSDYQEKAQACQSCGWLNICGGGSLINRFKKENRFSNASVYCDGLRQFFSHVSQFLLTQGFGFSDISAALQDKVDHTAPWTREEVVSRPGVRK